MISWNGVLDAKGLLDTVGVSREVATAHQFSITNKSATPPEDLGTAAAAAVAVGTEQEKKALLPEKTGGATDQKHWHIISIYKNCMCAF